jgi:hypothetical protein
MRNIVSIDEVRQQKPFEVDMNDRIALTARYPDAIVPRSEEAAQRCFDYRDRTKLHIAHAAVRPFPASDDAVIEESV